VACPFFVPVRAVTCSGWICPPRMPLGDIYSGLCCAGPGDPNPPPEARQQLCNRGYARGECECFPPDTAADAVRFSITGEADGVIQMVYVIEKDHAPLEHGPLEFGDALTGAEGRDVLAAQARAFVTSYRGRRIP
jgi:hypothetical protein